MRALQRLSPLASRLRYRLGGNNDYKTHAHRSWVIHPEETATAPAALFDPDDLQRISGVFPGDTIEGQIERARGGSGRHDATVAYELRDATLARGHLFTPKVHYQIGRHRAPVFADRPTREYAHAVLASSPYGIKYFGHWMTDDLPLHLAARAIGDPVSMLTSPTPSQRFQLELLGIESDITEDAYFERIVVIDDVGQNSYKRARFEELRAKAAVAGPSSPSPGVMLLRGTAGARRSLANEAEVAAVARARGFDVLDPASTDPEQLMRACVGARVVLGVEGSNLTNGMIWMSPQGTLVAIQPPDRFVMVLKDWCDCMHIRYAFLVGHARERGTFEVDIDALEKMLDVAQR